MLWIGFHRGAVVFDRLVVLTDVVFTELAHLVEQRRRGRPGWRYGELELVGLQQILPATRSIVDPAEVAERRRVLRIEREDLLVSGERAVDVAEPLVGDLGGSM